MTVLARIFVVGVVLITTPGASSERDIHCAQSDADLPAPRLERLESLMEQFQGQWRREKQELRDRLQRSQTVTQELTAALTHTQALTQNLQAENQELKTRLDGMQRELDSVKQQQREQQEPLREVEQKQQQQQQQRQQSPLTMKAVKADGPSSPKSSQADSQPDATSLWSGADTPPRHVLTSSSNGHVLTSRSDDHVLTSRSDDLGSMEVQVSHLAQAVTGLTADVQALQTSNTQLQNSQGSSFVQWGSSTCAGSAQLVYSGVLGGSWHDQPGAAANPLCLTLDPVLEEPQAGHVVYTNIHGGEYETYDSSHEKDPVCAVCRTPHHQTTIMVPGTNLCTSGWTRQYSGHLMAGFYGHHGATQFICVDSKMESEVGSQDNQNGHLLYYTQTRCGSLPCPPYEDGKVMTCVVCSQ